MSEQNKNTNNFGVGLLVGMIAGAVAGIFMTSNKGKQMRKQMEVNIQKLRKMIAEGELQEQVQKTFGEVNEQAMDLYENGRKQLIKRLDEVRTNIDKAEYQKIVGDVTDTLKGPKEYIMKIRDSFMEGWNEADTEEKESSSAKHSSSSKKSESKSGDKSN